MKNASYEKDPWRIDALCCIGNPFAADAALSSLSDLVRLRRQPVGQRKQRRREWRNLSTPPYYNNQFSNGPVAVQQLWNSFNPGNTDFRPAAGRNQLRDRRRYFGRLELHLGPTDLPVALRAQYNNLGNAWQLQTFSNQLSGGRTFDAASSLFAVWLFPNDVYY